MAALHFLFVFILSAVDADCCLVCRCAHLMCLAVFPEVCEHDSAPQVCGDQCPQSKASKELQERQQICLGVDFFFLF